MEIHFLIIQQFGKTELLNFDKTKRPHPIKTMLQMCYSGF